MTPAIPLETTDEPRVVRCETCKFWKFRENREDTEPPEPLGTCKRFPPVTISSLVYFDGITYAKIRDKQAGESEFHQEALTAAGFDWNTHQPPTRHDDWCGEWQAKAIS